MGTSAAASLLSGGMQVQDLQKVPVRLPCQYRQIQQDVD